MPLKVQINGTKKQITRPTVPPVCFINGEKKRLTKGITFINGEKKILWGGRGLKVEYIPITTRGDLFYISDSKALIGNVPGSATSQYYEQFVDTLDISNINQAQLIAHNSWGLGVCFSPIDSNDSQNVYYTTLNESSSNIYTINTLTVTKDNINITASPRYTYSAAPGTKVGLQATGWACWSAAYKRGTLTAPPDVLWDNQKKYTASTASSYLIKYNESSFLNYYKSTIYHYTDTEKTTILAITGITGLLVDDEAIIVVGTQGMRKIRNLTGEIEWEYSFENSSDPYPLFLGKLGGWYLVETNAEILAIDSASGVLYSKIAVRHAAQSVSRTVIPHISNTGYLGYCRTHSDGNYICRVSLN